MMQNIRGFEGIGRAVLALGAAVSLAACGTTAPDAGATQPDAAGIEALASAAPAAGGTAGSVDAAERVVAPADSGTPISFTSSLTAAQRQLLHDQLPVVMAASGGARITVANVDLNDDGQDEAIYIVHSGPYCGSGGVCNIWMFGQGPDGWQRINTDRDAGISMSLLPSSNQGYHDLAIHGSCYGEACDFILGWDGSLYHWLGRDAG